MKATGLMLALAISAQAQSHQTVIPFVTVGSEVTVMNDEPSPQHVEVRFGSTVTTYAVRAQSVLRIKSPDAGFVVINPELNPVVAWSVVEGCNVQSVTARCEDSDFCGRCFYRNRDRESVARSHADELSGCTRTAKPCLTKISHSRPTRTALR